MWTEEQIVPLALDPASARAGAELAVAARWTALVASETAISGVCQGGGTPYRVAVALHGPLILCSCPSRKRPCKHGLALLLLHVRDRAAFSDGAHPSWALEWLAPSTGRKAERGDKAVDTEAKAKRVADREAKVAAGVGELQRWLADLVIHGIADAPAREGAFWEGMAARLVDAQAPGLARRVRDLADVATSGVGWQERMLLRLGRLHLLVEAYPRQDALPADLRAEVRAQVGWTQSQEELMAQDGVRDQWQVLGTSFDDDGHLRTRRQWLAGVSSGRHALVLTFAVGNQPFMAAPPVGTRLDAELVFFPGASPMRALIKEILSAPTPVTTVKSLAGVAGLHALRAEMLASNPWRDVLPATLSSVIPVRDGERWLLRDAGGASLRLPNAFTRGWELLAISGGHPITIFGEARDDEILPLSILTEGRLVALTQELE
ncbi:MAG: SWIM zinc finger family protein [Myxococcota bacterium]